MQTKKLIGYFSFVLILFSFVCLIGVNGDKYSCPNCGYSKTYFGIYKLFTPDKTCPKDKIVLIK